MTPRSDLSRTIIQTSRLILKAINRSYGPEILKHFTAEVAQYMSPGPSRDLQELDSFLMPAIEGMKDGTNLQLVILRRGDEEFIGCAGLHHLDCDTPELGIWTKKKSHGHGFGFETIAALIEWANKHFDYKYLRYPVDKRNVPSRRIPERLGGVVGAEYKKASMSGFELDELEYWIYR